MLVGQGEVVAVKCGTFRDDAVQHGQGRHGTRGGLYETVLVQTLHGVEFLFIGNDTTLTCAP